MCVIKEQSLVCRHYTSYVLRDVLAKRIRERYLPGYAAFLAVRPVKCDPFFFFMPRGRHSCSCDECSDCVSPARRLHGNDKYASAFIN